MPEPRAVTAQPVQVTYRQTLFSSGKQRRIIMVADPISGLLEFRLQGERTGYILTAATLMKYAVTAGEKERLNT